MHFSKKNLRQPSKVTQCPMAAAASITDDHNITELARLMGKNKKTLAAKLNNDDAFDQHNLHLIEAVAVTELTNDERILSAWANSRGKVLVSLPKTGLTDEEFSDQLLIVSERMGDFSKSLREARADGVITSADHAEIKRRAMAAIESIMQLELECAGMVRNLPGDDLGE